METTHLTYFKISAWDLFIRKGFFNFAKYKTKKHNHYGLAIYSLLSKYMQIHVNQFVWEYVYVC